MHNRQPLLACCRRITQVQSCMPLKVRHLFVPSCRRAGATAQLPIFTSNTVSSVAWNNDTDGKGTVTCSEWGHPQDKERSALQVLCPS